MAPKPNIDKGSQQTRSYRSDLRRQQAEQTRQRIVAAAADLFAADGYPRTTLAKIAAAAGVSTETVAAQGPKAVLMVAAMEYAMFGVSGEENVLNLDIGRRYLEIDNRDDALDYWVATQIELHERGAGLAQALIGAAASDPELNHYLDELFAGITKQARRVLVVARDRGWLRDDVPFDELVLTSTVASGIDTFLRVTRRDGWSVPRYRTWLRRILAETTFARA
ncbi:TetR/AcrR family transcriptional regulator [Mycobacterium sp. RTGN5]|uniref:TetR/AcrR family transcriptional regulator n=1 Tax=Mycobacterium sp. RTGN5 TaxID=3016522 RepID=UPI0029C96680|nr:TetR family transcriptional regulator [Mycobacterium sp. RTGN5]